MPKGITRFAAISLVGLALAGCSGSVSTGAKSPTQAARDAGPRSRDPEVVGRWYLAELLTPDGTAKGVKNARKRLTDLKDKGMLGGLAFGLDSLFHGQERQAAFGFLGALEAASQSTDPLAPAVAWYATNQLLRLSNQVRELWPKARTTVARLLKNPGHIGWRARAELVEWWSRGAYRDAQKDVPKQAAAHYGCLKKVRLAGPFGHGEANAPYTEFGPERPGAWPQVWPKESRQVRPPRVIPVETPGCTVRSKSAIRNGIFYAEAYIDLDRPSEVLVAVQGALKVWVDDYPVLERDLRRFGVWPTFGAAVGLRKGRHRIVARLADPETSLRVLKLDGSPSGIKNSDGFKGTYVSARPRKLADPNWLNRYLSPDRVRAPKDELSAYLAAFLASIEGQNDVANVLLEPLIRDEKKASALALMAAASYASQDPIFPESDAKDLSRLLYEKASAKDPKLYYPKLWLIVDKAEKGSVPEATKELRKLADQFPEVPEMLRVLTTFYARLGWRGERAKTIRKLLKRFPNDRQSLEMGIALHERSGELKQADALVARLKQLYPDSEIELDRALARHDYPAAIAELKRLGKRRPERKDIALRIARLLERSGKGDDPVKRLEALLEKKPQNSSARLALADARLAAGDGSALQSGLAKAIQAGANPHLLRNAIALKEGLTEMAPYRKDARTIIKAFEKAGRPGRGTAARVLDYAVLWVQENGASRMLEHEIIRIQSQEAINRLVEQRPPRGATVLHMRVHKKDGRVLEPERVAGKPTVTMPHLENGDYIETEWIIPSNGDGEGGQRYLSPRWFFREADIAYWRSEYVVIVPGSKKLQIETTGKVPKPTISKELGLTRYGWRVDNSPAAPVEPSSVPIREFLPSVRIGWGITEKGRLARMADAASGRMARDPRLVKIARKMTAGAESDIEKAQKIYRWIMDNVQKGREGDGRRVVIGKSGSRAAAFVYLARCLGLKLEVAAVRNRLRRPGGGPIHQAFAYQGVVIRLLPRDGKGKPVWLTIGNKHAPFGYVPAEYRGQPAKLIERKGFPDTKAPATGSVDGMRYAGDIEVRRDGSAKVKLQLSFLGALGIGARSSLEQVPEARLKAVVESKILGRALPGVRVLKLKVQNKDAGDKPLVFDITAEVSNFARRRGNQLVVKTPLMMRISSMAALQSRATPMMLPEATYSEVKLTLHLPSGASMDSKLDNKTISNGERTYTVNDVFGNQGLVIHRKLHMPAGRIKVEDYSLFRAFTIKADAATRRELVIKLP